MRTVAFLNLKGGVGKTVTAINVAYILAAEHRQRVLLIDADSQCNTSAFLGADPEEGSLAEVLTAPDGAYGVSCIQPTDYAYLDLLAASDVLMDLDLSQIKNDHVRPAALAEMAAHLVATDRAYDWIFYDCPPAFNAASTAALVASDEVVIPTKLDAFSLQGMANLLRQVANMRKINPKLRVAGCLPTMYYRDEVIDQALETLRASVLPVFDSKIRRSKKMDGMTFAQKPISIFSPRSSAGVDYRRFVRELMHRKGGASCG